MSYILDALRRAEAERSRGSVPHLHAPMPGLDLGAAAQPAPSALRRHAGWLVAAAALLVAGVAWWRAGGAPMAPAVPMAAPAASGPSGSGIGQATAPRPVPALAPNPAGSVAAIPGVAVTPPASPRAADAAQATPPPPPPASPARAPTRNADEAAAPRPAPRPAAPSRGDPPAETRTAAAAPLPNRRDLPPALQQALPPLGFGGTVYASRPSERMVVVNGEVWREGDRIAPGVVVEEIRRKDAVLSIQGQRFVLAP